MLQILSACCLVHEPVFQDTVATTGRCYTANFHVWCIVLKVCVRPFLDDAECYF